jgi:DNA-binding XRE family transcriptional regulator
MKPHTRQQHRGQAKHHRPHHRPTRYPITHNPATYLPAHPPMPGRQAPPHGRTTSDQKHQEPAGSTAHAEAAVNEAPWLRLLRRSRAARGRKALNLVPAARCPTTASTQTLCANPASKSHTVCDSLGGHTATLCASNRLERRRCVSEPESIGRRIAEQRRLRGWTQRDLARRAGYSFSAVEKIERGLRAVSTDIQPSTPLQAGL